MSDEKPRRCTTCRNCYLEDYGYSNYTVEGTTVDCLLDLNPDLPQEDSGWDWDPASKDHRINRFAEGCARYEPGEPMNMDVDHEAELGVLEQVRADADRSAAWDRKYQQTDYGWWERKKA